MAEYLVSWTDGKAKQAILDFIDAITTKELVYQPMLELFNLLKSNDFRIFVCSGGG